MIFVPQIGMEEDVPSARGEGRGGLPPKLFEETGVTRRVREPINTGWIVVRIDPGNHNFTCPLRPNGVPIRFGWNIVDIVLIRIMERGPDGPRLFGSTLIIGVTVSPLFVKPTAECHRRCPVCLNIRSAAIGARIGGIGIAIDKRYIMTGQFQAEIGVNSADLKPVDIRSIPDDIIVIICAEKSYLDAVFSGDLEGVHASNAGWMPYGSSAARRLIVHGVG